jgi:hypothetical protein
MTKRSIVAGARFGLALALGILWMPADTVRAVVEDVRQSDGVASAVTREHVRSAQTFALATVWQRLARVARSSALIASASCMNPTEM